MPKQIKEIIEIDHLPCLIFKILQGYWGGKSSNGKPALKTKDAYELMKKPFAELGRHLSIQTLRNNLRTLSALGMLLKDPPELKRGGGGKTTFEINWKFLESHAVTFKPITNKNKWYQRKAKGPVKPPKPDTGQGNSNSGSAKPTIRCLQIMRALPDLRTETQIKKNPLDRAIEELPSSTLMILCTESDISNTEEEKNKLGLKEFKLLYPDHAMDSILTLMFHKGSHLEVVIRGKEKGKKKIKYLAIIARLAMDCILNGKPMTTDQEYPLEPDIPNLLVIDDEYEYIARALGF